MEVFLYVYLTNKETQSQSRDQKDQVGVPSHFGSYFACRNEPESGPSNHAAEPVNFQPREQSRGDQAGQKHHTPNFNFESFDRNSDMDVAPVDQRIAFIVAIESLR